LQRAVGDKSALAWSLDRLGDILLHENDVSQAEAAYSECFALFREVEHRGGMAASLHKLGSRALNRDDLDLAWRLTTESLDLNRDLSYRQGIIDNLVQMGTIAQHRKDFSRARSLCREALTHARALGNNPLISRSIGKQAELAAAQHNWEHAALLLGIADMFGATSESIQPQAQQSLKTAEMVRSQLGDRHYSSLHARGLAMPQGDGISVALHYDPPAVHPAGILQPSRQGDLNEEISGDTDNQDDLTKRELEVLKLMAEGLTDAQVADRLVLSTRTVQAHVRSIYSKLDIATRSAATRYAIKRGLV